MNCAETLDLMDVALDGTIATTLRPDFDAHIAACRVCRCYYEQITLTVGALGRLPHVVSDNPRRTQLLERFRSRGHGRSGRTRSSRKPRRPS